MTSTPPTLLNLHQLELDALNDVLKENVKLEAQIAAETQLLEAHKESAKEAAKIHEQRVQALKHKTHLKTRLRQIRLERMQCMT